MNFYLSMNFYRREIRLYQDHLANNCGSYIMEWLFSQTSTIYCWAVGGQAGTLAPGNLRPQPAGCQLWLSHDASPQQANLHTRNAFDGNLLKFSDFFQSIKIYSYNFHKLHQRCFYRTHYLHYWDDCLCFLLDKSSR